MPPIGRLCAARTGAGWCPARAGARAAMSPGAGGGSTGHGRRGWPGGRYVVLRHVGPYDGLVASNAALQRWAQQQGVGLDSWDTAEGTAWRGRVEHYLTNPAAEPDPAKWETDVAYLASET